MKTRAAVAVEAGKPLEIMDVDLEGPRSGEVLVEIKATGICQVGADVNTHAWGVAHSLAKELQMLRNVVSKPERNQRGEMRERERG